MKIDWNKKYTTISVYAFLVICASIIFFSIIGEIDAFTTKLGWVVSTLQPFIIGFVMAYLFNFILVFDLVKNLKKKSKRGISIVLTYLTVFFIIALFMQFVLPQLVDSIAGLVNDVPTYVSNATKLIEELTRNLDANNEYVGMAMEKWNEIVTYTINVVTNVLPILGNVLKVVASSIWNIVLGLIVSIYLLIDKEKFCALSRKITCALFNEEHSQVAIDLAHRTNDTFGKFLSGKIIDSAIIGILTFIILVIIMFVSPVKALWFLLIILIIQQLDGNVIGPKILGDSIGISAFWILFALLVAGKILGLVGMIIGVPLFAIIYSIIKDITESKLRKKGLPTETSDYMKNARD